MKLKGTVKDKSVVVVLPVSVADGTEVEVDLKFKHPLLEVFGILKDDNEWDRILEDIYAEREKNTGREVHL